MTYKEILQWTAAYAAIDAAAAVIFAKISNKAIPMIISILF